MRLVFFQYTSDPITFVELSSDFRLSPWIALTDPKDWSAEDAERLKTVFH
jgi:uncharacterized membrane protein